MKKIFIFLSLVIFCTLRPYNLDYPRYKLARIYPSPQPTPVWQNQKPPTSITTPLIIAGTALALGYAIYKYWTRFNMQDARNLSLKINKTLNEIKIYYNKELLALTLTSDQNLLYQQLDGIVLQIVSPSPYSEYASHVSAYLNLCDNYIKTIESGLPKLKKAYDSSSKKVYFGYDPRMDLEAKDYLDVMTTLEALESELIVMYNQLSKLATFCWQSDGYKQEQVLAQLKTINTNLELNRIIQSCNNFNTTRVYVM